MSPARQLHVSDSTIPTTFSQALNQPYQNLSSKQGFHGMSPHVVYFTANAHIRTALGEGILRGGGGGISVSGWMQITGIPCVSDSELGTAKGTKGDEGQK